MKRRAFIKIIVAGSGVTLVPSMLNGCGTKPLRALEGWKGPNSAERDIRLLVLSYAILAPNPHNKQPWLIALKDSGSFDLYVDKNRLLPESDPFFRQIHIGQGTFLENLDLAARHFGYAADIIYFPDGMYENTVLEHKPIASIQLTRNNNQPRDILFDHIPMRQSNRRAYTDHAISDQHFSEMRNLAKPEASACTLTLSNNQTMRQKLADFATEAMRIDVSDNKRNAESIAMFRFNDSELEQHRDGFGVPQSGRAGLQKFLVENFFVSREKWLGENSTWAAESIQGTRHLADSAAAYGWLSTHTNTRLDQVMAGRLYNRVNLAATRLGIAMQPLSQILQEYGEMQPLQAALKDYLQIAADHTVQMFFRLGFAEPIAHTARREVKDFLS